jgi:DNA-directed RNA polymerase beta subunit
MRQVHEVEDKIHARDEGRVVFLTRQPVEGRSRKGALRWGSMELLALVSHGASSVCVDKLCTASDEFQIAICSKCRFKCDVEKKSDDPYIPAGKPFCRKCQTSDHAHTVTVPYSCHLLTSELEAAHFQALYTLRPKIES